MINIGQIHNLPVIKFLSFGAYLDADELGEVLLPNKFIPEDLLVDDEVEVFLYFDSEDRLIATTQTPKACVNECAYLKVVESNRVGAFLDWGIDKDLLVPFSEQQYPMQEGDYYLVYLYIDKTDGRIVASAKLDKFIQEENPDHFTAQQGVDLIIANSTELGYKAIINHHYWGVLYKNEVFQRLSFGQSIKGFIKQIRSDGKIDLSLQGGQISRDKDVQKVLEYLKNKNGFAPVHDKSDPQLIKKLFMMSKGAFKKAIGHLYKQKIIRIDKQGIYLI